MKTLIAFVISFVFCLEIHAQALQGTKVLEPVKNKAMFCASLQDGKMVVFYEGKIVTTDIDLPNGTKITTDGTVIKKDGSKTMLRSGECVDKNGNSEKMTQVK